jgi:hypothetical protein
MALDNQEDRRKAGGDFGELWGRNVGRAVGEASGVPGGGSAGEAIGGPVGRIAGEHLYGAPPEVAEVLAKEHFLRRCGR